MLKVVYVTGCLGFIGSYITRECLSRGWFVRGVDKCTYAANEQHLNEFQKNVNFAFDRCDICDLSFLYDCDYIINTAAETHVDNSITSSEEFVQSNICGVYNILNLIKSKKGHDMPVLLHFSTDEVYGDIISGEHTESSILRPSNPYSATKASGDMLITAWSRTHGIPYVLVRPSNNYGIGQYVEKLIPKACKFLKLGKTIPLHEAGEPVRTWLHAKDTTQAIMKIIYSNKKNCIFNISGTEQLKNIDVISQIVKIYYNDDVNIMDYVDLNFSRPGQDVRYSINCDKLEGLGWSPNHRLSDELPGVVEHYKDNFIW